MDYTDAELEQLPQTETVFDAPALEFDHHDWQQQGYWLTDACETKTGTCHTGGLSIPSGTMLVKQNGGYQLIDELTRQSV